MAKDNPNAAKIGHFAITKTPEKSAESESNHGKNIVDINTKHYKFDARNSHEETILQRCHFEASILRAVQMAASC